MAGHLPKSSNYGALGEDPFTFKNCRPGLVSRRVGTPGDIFTGSQSGIKELASQLGSAPSKARKGHGFAKLMTTFQCRVPATKGF